MADSNEIVVDMTKTYRRLNMVTEEKKIEYEEDNVVEEELEVNR